MSALLRTSPRILIPDRKRCRDYGVVWLSGGMRGGDKLHDISPRKQHGSLTNGPTWTNGFCGQPAISFTRASSHHLTGNLAFTANALTIAGWVRPASFNAFSGDPNYQVSGIMEIGSGAALNGAYLHLGVLGTNTFRGYYYSSASAVGIVAGTTVPTLGSWYHVAYTVDGANAKLYVNGALEGTTAATGAIDDSTIFSIGRTNYSGGSQFFDGLISQLSVHSVASTAKQITNLYKRPFYLYRNPPSQFNVGWAAPATTVPGAPTLSMTVSSGTLHFTWTNGATGGTPITGYKLYVGTSSGGESLKYDDVTLTAGMSSYDDSVSISDGTTYWAYLTALNAVGESAASNEVSGTPPGSSPQTITITVASATASASAPTVTPGTATVTMPVASSTSSAIIPTVTPSATTIIISTCSATAAASAPTLTPTVTIVLPTASATASATTPTITAGTSTITVTTASATGTASAPTITPTVDIASPTASATAAATAPSVTAGATTITITTASATAAATAPDVTNATLITPGEAVATASAIVPTVTPGGATIVVTTASATATAIDVTVSAGTTTITVGVASAVAGVSALVISAAGEAAGSLLFTVYATPSIRSLASLQPSLDADAYLRPSIEGKVS